MNENFKYIECDCQDASHVLRIYQTDDGWGDDDEPFLVIETQLKPANNFFSRLKLSFRYLFGLTDSNCWPSVLVNGEKGDQLKIIVHQFTAAHHKWKIEREKKLYEKN